MILDHVLTQTPFAVIDVETTGLSSRRDRIVEIAVALVHGGGAPRLVLETLVNPGQTVGQTDIHGLTDADVAEAPWFPEIADSIAAAIASRVVVSHNVYFDMRFLRAELRRAGLSADVPHLCTARLPRLIGRPGAGLDLQRACMARGIELAEAHAAAADALAAARVLQQQLMEAHRAGIRTFRDLAEAGTYEFLDSFVLTPLSAPPLFATACNHHPRTNRGARRRTPLATYLDLVLTVVADLHVAENELREVQLAQKELALSDAQIRAAHARVFDAMLDRFTEDHEIDEAEAENLARLHRALARLGWAPGQRLDPC